MFEQSVLPITEEVMLKWRRLVEGGRRQFKTRAIRPSPVCQIRRVQAHLNFSSPTSTTMRSSSGPGPFKALQLATCTLAVGLYIIIGLDACCDGQTVGC
jgi:hypothetical protein